MEEIYFQQIFKCEKEHWWYRGRRELLKWVVAPLVTTNRSKILDVGCGGGYTLDLLTAFGDVNGADISPQAVAHCRDNGFENTILVEENRPLPFIKNNFDLITCLDVLEHIHDDQNCLLDIKRILAPSGYLVLFVPALHILWSKLDDGAHHYRRYTKRQLFERLKNCGYKVKKISYFNFLLFPPIFLIRIFQKLYFFQKNKWGVHPIIRSTWINKILMAIFRLDIVLLRWISPVFGVSIFAVAQKMTTTEFFNEDSSNDDAIVQN